MPETEHPVIRREDIATSLRRMGLRDGESVLVHSSLSSFGYVEGGADSVIDALIEVTGPRGHVAVPTLTGRQSDGPADPPHFDVRRSPCWTGRIPNTFLKRSEAVRSLHPTHSVAVSGPLAHELTKDHQLASTPCGRATPYLRLADNDAYILLLGVGQQSNTTLHTVEELANVPYHLQGSPTTSTVIDYEGREWQVTGYLHDWGTPRRFEIIDPELEARGIMTVGRIGKSQVRMIRARAMIDLLVLRLQKNPFYLCQPGSHDRSNAAIPSADK